MTWHRQIAEATVEELVRNNPPDFMARQWQRACQDYLRFTRLAWEAERIAYGHSNDGYEIARRAQRLIHEGRKTVRLADLLAGTGLEDPA